MIQGLKIGLALGGGAARGLAHIGIIEALEEQGIEIDLIAGTSMGAIIGADYALHRDVQKLHRRFADYLQSEAYRESQFAFMQQKDEVEGEGIFLRFSRLARRGIFFTSSLTRKSFVSEEDAARHFALLIDDRRLEETRIPFLAVALDLISGREVLLDHGPMRPAIAASCALPGILPPVNLQGRLLVDGGWINAVPVEPLLHRGADFVIAVDVSRDLSDFEGPGNGLQVVFRADAVTRHVLAAERMRAADIVLSPAVRQIHWSDFTRAEETIRHGRDAALEAIAEIRRLLRRKKWRKALGGFWPGRPEGGQPAVSSSEEVPLNIP